MVLLMSKDFYVKGKTYISKFGLELQVKTDHLCYKDHFFIYIYKNKSYFLWELNKPIKALCESNDKSLNTDVGRHS